MKCTTNLREATGSYGKLWEAMGSYGKAVGAGTGGVTQLIAAEGAAGGRGSGGAVYRISPRATEGSEVQQRWRSQQSSEDLSSLSTVLPCLCVMHTSNNDKKRAAAFSIHCQCGGCNDFKGLLLLLLLFIFKVNHLLDKFPLDVSTPRDLTLLTLPW